MPPISTPSPTTTRSTGTPAARTLPSTTPPDLATIRSSGGSVAEGHRGPVVKNLQQRLNAAGADPPLKDDGAFGPLTRGAVEQFQRQQGLVVDGKIGPRTLAALDAVAAARPGDGLDAGARRQGALPTPVRPGAGPGSTTPSPTPTTTPRRGLGGATPANGPVAAPTLPAGLSATARTTVSEALAGTRGPEAQRAMRDLMATSQFRSLPEAARARLLSTASRPVGLLGGVMSAPGASLPPGAAAAQGRVMAARVDEATRLMTSPSSTRMSAADRARLVDVYAAAPGPDLLRLAGVGASERLTGRDLQGGTMLTHLHGLATGPLASGLDRASLLRSTIAEVENPANIEQHRQGTCAATSVVLRVAERSPAEYARLVAGLSTPSGRVTLKDGSTLARNVGSIADTRSGRTQSERMLQDAFMGYANGTLNYDVAADTSRGEGGGGGLNLAEVSRLQEGVFGEPYRTVTSVGRQVTRDAGTTDRLWRNFRNNVDRLTFRHDPNSPMVMLRQELAAGRDAVIGMRWGQEGHSAHAVVVERIENGRVFFQNPHGNAYHRQAIGSSLSPPPRRVEAGNIQSMTLEDFQTRLSSVSVRGEGT
jgi:peptidoglycan hydrolase-like protein with peptidoglycan-binding domain